MIDHPAIIHYTMNMKSTNNRKLNKTMLERLIIIHNAIKAGTYPNNMALRRLYAETIGTKKLPGEATINRDIDCLRVRFNAPIEYDRAKNGFYYLDDNFEFALNQISASDMQSLSAAKALLARFRGSPLYEEISGVIDFVIDTQAVGKSDFLKRIAVSPSPEMLVDEKIWAQICEAMKSNSIVEFDYNGRWRTETTHRRIRPYQLLLEDGVCYLFGFAEERGEERLFSLARIKNLTVTEENFTLPEDFEFASRAGGGKFGAFQGGVREKCTIEFYEDACAMVKERVWADDQKITESGDCLTISFTTAQTYKVLEWILSCGYKAKPLEPEWLVSEWRENIQRMSRLAKG